MLSVAEALNMQYEFDELSPPFPLAGLAGIACDDEAAELVGCSLDGVVGCFRRTSSITGFLCNGLDSRGFESST